MKPENETKDSTDLGGSAGVGHPNGRTQRLQTKGAASLFVFETWMELLTNVKTPGIHGFTDSVLVRKGRSCF